jgi:hypothetical protein
LSSL